MPKGPNGEWRPADTSQAAVTVMRIATGEIEETKEPVEVARMSPELLKKVAEAKLQR